MIKLDLNRFLDDLYEINEELGGNEIKSILKRRHKRRQGRCIF